MTTRSAETASSDREQPFVTTPLFEREDKLIRSHIESIISNPQDALDLACSLNGIIANRNQRADTMIADLKARGIREDQTVKVNDAVAIPNRDSDDDPDQEVLMGRVVALTEDGRVIAERRASWGCNDLYMEDHCGQFPRIGRWELEQPAKRLLRSMVPEWKFRSS